jgi:hypothetical protein
VQLARNGGRIVAGERHSQHLGRGGHGARGEHALERGALCDEPLLLLAPALGDALRRRLQRALFGGKPRQASIGLRDGALRVAQRVARLAARAFLRFQLLREGVDARAQLRQLLLSRLRLRDADQQEKSGKDQTFALPCASTAAMRFSISAASPR